MTSTDRFALKKIKEIQKDIKDELERRAALAKNITEHPTLSTGSITRLLLYRLDIKLQALRC